METVHELVVRAVLRSVLKAPAQHEVNVLLYSVCYGLHDIVE